MESFFPNPPQNETKSPIYFDFNDLEKNVPIQEPYNLYEQWEGIEAA